MVTLPHASFDTRNLVHAAQQGLASICRKGYRYKKAGVMLLDVTPEAHHQLSLGETPQTDAERQRNARLMTAMDTNNRGMGRGTLQIGTTRQRQTRHVKASRRTQRYTTCWDELPEAKT